MIHKSFGKGKCLNGNKPNDKVFTPLNVAKQIIDLIPLSGKVLDPFMGGGAFYNQLPNCVEKEWCEIDKGKDFFKYDKNVDFIISNPPYSILDEVLQHSFEIANNVIYLVPLSKIVSSMGRIRKIARYGGVKELYYLSASKCGFPFGFPCCVIWVQKNYEGDLKIKEL